MITSRLFFIIYLFQLILRIAMTDDDIEETLKEKWAEVLNSYNDELISQQLKSFETKQDNTHMLKYQGKFNFIVGRYEQAIVDLAKLLELETNNTFALRYRGETYFMIEKYEESLVDLNKLLEINANDAYTLKFCENVKE
jgi:tetratricopeptide (TPR) repeat protein